MRAAATRAVADTGVEAMTEPAPQKNRRPGPAMVFSGAIALFAITFGFLIYQLRSGNDPSLGAQALAVQPRPVVVRKVIKHRIITTVVPSEGASGTTVSTSAAPVTSSVAAAAPAPVTTGAS